MEIFELLWKRCFLYTANNGINDFLTKKKKAWVKKKKTILSWCVMFKIQKKDMFKWKQKHIYSCVNLFFLPINYLASYLYNFICLIKKPIRLLNLPPCCYYYCTISIIQKLMLLVQKNRKKNTLGCSYSKCFTVILWQLFDLLQFNLASLP